MPVSDVFIRDDASLVDDRNNPEEEQRYDESDKCSFTGSSMSGMVSSFDTSSSARFGTQSGLLSSSDG